MPNFIQAGRKTDCLLPPSVDDWLNEDHLTRQYAGRGSKARHPATLLAILVYGYATGVFSSRRLERATYDSAAFCYIAAGTHPDHGTKVHANASRHSALSHGHIGELEVQINAEVQELFALAEQADQANLPDGVSLPDETKRREDRLSAMAAAKAKIAARAEERYQREKAEYDERMATHAAKEKDSGRKPGGNPPQAPVPGAKDSDQINLTDAQSRIMPVSGGGFEQCYNTQTGVDAATMLVVATGVTQAPTTRSRSCRCSQHSKRRLRYWAWWSA
jgi:hypothetical protein